MIQIEGTIIRKLIYHRFNKDTINSEYSENLFEYSIEEEEATLKKIFLNPFLTASSTNEFTHEIDLELNPLFKLSNAIYGDEDFIENSKHIHQHLVSVSKHPNIKDGDLFIVKFDEIGLNNKLYQGLGIYKIENKESFIEITDYNKKQTGLAFKKGIGTKRLDKACLIIFTEKPFTVFVIDSAKTETDYWQNEFIKSGLKNDNVNHTNQFLSITKNFITKQFPADFETTKADQIDLLNRSVDYFKKHETFDKQEFEKEVFHFDNIISSFNKFDSNYRQENEIDIADDFSISPQAVKKQERAFKSVLKLDKNFHIYIHGDKTCIEKGVDKDGRRYYKLYYDTES
jgi:37-kD nucleoid-associated bacterial protein